MLGSSGRTIAGNRRGVTRAGVGRWVAIGCVLAAAVAALLRLPAAVRSFDDRATANDRIVGVGRQISGADAEDIDNEFLVEALQLLPLHARYAILRSQSPEVAQQYGISAPTYNALPGLVQNVLLPRRQVDPADAEYVLCYACDTDPYDPRMTRLWEDQHGLLIGKLRR